MFRIFFITFTLSLLYVSPTVAQEREILPVDDSESIREMMNDKEFQKFLKKNEQAFPSPVMQQEDGVQRTESKEDEDRYRQLRHYQRVVNRRNRNTVGYKRWEYDLYSPRSPLTPDFRQLRTPASVGIRVDMRPGKIRETDREFDCAIEGDGFFCVSDPETARILVTRCGSFERDSQGFLALIQGERAFRLTPEIPIPSDYRSLQVSEDGTVQLATENDPTPQTVGKIELLYFANPQRLLPVDDRCFIPTSLSGPAKNRALGEKRPGKIKQFALEQSNVVVSSR